MSSLSDDSSITHHYCHNCHHYNCRQSSSLGLGHNQCFFLRWEFGTLPPLLWTNFQRRFSRQQQQQKNINKNKSNTNSNQNIQHRFSLQQQKIWEKNYIFLTIMYSLLMKGQKPRLGDSWWAKLYLLDLDEEMMDMFEQKRCLYCWRRCQY